MEPIENTEEEKDIFQEFDELSQELYAEANWLCNQRRKGKKIDPERELNHIDAMKHFKNAEKILASVIRMNRVNPNEGRANNKKFQQGFREKYKNLENTMPDIIADLSAKTD